MLEEENIFQNLLCKPKGSKKKDRFGKKSEQLYEAATERELLRFLIPYSPLNYLWKRFDRAALNSVPALGYHCLICMSAPHCFCSWEFFPPQIGFALLC